MKDKKFNLIKKTVRKTINKVSITVKLPFINFSFAPLIFLPKGYYKNPSNENLGGFPLIIEPKAY